MKASELRIGNLYYYKMVDKCDERKEWEEVTAIDAMDIDHLLKFPDDPDYRAIPLTEEILKDWCGFGKTEANEAVLRLGGNDNLGGFELFGNESFGFKLAEYSDRAGDYGVWNEIKYLHQLQNLYFALTGEELEIKLPKQ